MSIKPISEKLASSMKLGGLVNLKRQGGIKAGELTVIAGASSGKSKLHVDPRLPRTLTGKAMLMVDCAYRVGGSGEGFITHPSIKTANGDHPDDAYAELAHFGTEKAVVPNQCWRMKVGDRWRIDVVYRITYEPTIDHEGNEDWEVTLEFLKAKTRTKSPWNPKRHQRYVSKSKR